MKKETKIIIFVIIISILPCILFTIWVLITGEGIGTDNRYGGKRPEDYGDAKWVCEETSAWFIADSIGNDYPYQKGEVIIDGETVQIGFRFITGTNQVIIDFIGSSAQPRRIGYDEALEGECEFSPEKLIIKIDKETDRIFNGRYDELTFSRIDN